MTITDPLYRLNFLVKQRILEEVSPKMQAFRRPAQFKLARGGRAAGAKSWGAVSLLIQRAHRQKTRIACLREIQKSLEESAYQLFCDTIERLRYPGWKITKESLDSPCGSHIIFRGLKDYHHAKQAKGLEKYDIFYCEEASDFSSESISILLPTLFRTDGAEFWGVYNQEEDPDPITDLVWNRDYENIIRVEMEAGPKDNPWWNDALQMLMESDYAYDADLAEHVWGGQPRKQGEKAVFSRASVDSAMRRRIDGVGQRQVGADVARFGSDRSVGYRRHGLKVEDSFCVQGYDTLAVANAIWDLALHRPDTPIKIDAGYNPGVIDVVRKLGGQVIEVNFGGSPMDKDKYTSAADEMWFEMPITEAQIPDDNDLKRELCGRRYDYERHTNRKKIETKDEYKKRLKRSPDKADALLLCFYEAKNIIMTDEQRKQLQSRWRE